MARKRPSCRIGETRYTVLQVGSDPYDSHAARSFERALKLANPDRGTTVHVWTVCAKNAGEARLPSAYKKRGVKRRWFRSKRGG